ncbi:G-type lectin S-receptor-like serine/threonine-protein kinase SD2-5 [Vigna unguiculata]|uniref:G-type lectin S-receptor-like serine/threonine-protein kinase SD2-5 n=1 Tax=Vigna unguiculata TaxID=3917 RepID=UPI0010161C6B|nr:G-type lectin S-receptor-like serine/threonine-protein kinase SD2-5 [Vigna unguiculata]
MGKQWSIFCVMHTLLLCVLLSSEVVLTSILKVGKASPGIEGSQMNWIDKNGILLVSYNGDFGFGFVTTANDITLFLLAIVHMDSNKVVWVANRGLPVSNSDKFVFDEKGNLYLLKGSTVVWSTGTEGKNVSSMELKDTGNLVLLRNDSHVIWQSFSHPADTLLPMQEFIEGMKLISEPGPNNLTYVLQIESGNAILSTGLQTPQPYWSLKDDSRKKIIYKSGGVVASATLNASFWSFFDETKSLLWQFDIAEKSDSNGTWILVLGSDGLITFSSLQREIVVSPITIPQDSCSTPEPCDPYYICSGGKKCTCPSVLSSSPNCKPGFVSPCSSKGTLELLKADDPLNYFALGFVPPSSKTDLIGCKTSCSANCSCLAFFFNSSSGNCFLLDWIGSFQKSVEDSGLVSYIKVVSSDGDHGDSESSTLQAIVVVIIVIATLFVICGMLFVAHRCFRKKQDLPESPEEFSEDESFLEGLTGMPIRYSYNDLKTATSNFSVKLGEGGFGSVYKGVVPDGTQLAVKKLEGIGQGKKEFKVEVSIIGRIHHHHLVRLKGFCAEGPHRLLAYEYMANGSLDKWIFNKHREGFVLDWDTRYNIALGTAKGLAYLHEDCDSKIIHCDIKPENVLLDDNFLVKVSDFGLAKLMTREQSHVFTTLRGTRGYLAPEWITNCAISEKSDVYSYGMVLLEIIGGRKNYDPRETSEKSHFPYFAFKMMEEGKVREIVDSKVETDENDERVETAVKVALWCIQEDMSLRPCMSKVVQMLEGLCTVSKPPTCSVPGSQFYSYSDAGTSSGPSDCNSDANLSAVRLSGPR